MPKLPSNLVKPPAFDNPFRRTSPAPSLSTELTADAPEAAEQLPGGVVIPLVASSQPADTELAAGSTEGAEPLAAGVTTPLVTDAPADGPAVEPEPAAHRITVRIDDALRCALESECYKRRIAGERTNLAEVARSILRAWASGTGAR